MPCVIVKALAVSLLLAVLLPYRIEAQGANPAPNTVTPPTLRPDNAPDAQTLTLPPTEALSPPEGAQLRFIPGRVVVEGRFSKVADQVAALARSIEGHSISLARLYGTASAIEAVHARAGFVLARVSVPPQRLSDGGPVRIVVTDGMIESIEVDHVPRHGRRTVAARLAGLRDVPQLTLAHIERQILLAGDVAGLTLRSTLARGNRAGGVRLIVEGTWRPLRAVVRSDNALDRSLADADSTLQVSSNGLLGFGETIYGYVGTSNPLRPLTGDTRVRVVGAGALFGVGDGRLVLNPEAALARTEPIAPPGVPRTEGRLERYALRATYAIGRTRTRQIGVDLAIDAIDQRTTALDFAADLARDRYAAARLGATLVLASARSNWTMSGQIGQGLGNLASDPGTPPSRQGAAATFTKISAQERVVVAIHRHLSLSASAFAQTSLGRPLLRAEQFQLEGTEAVSAFVGGVTTVDEGVTLRSELAAPYAIGHLALAPYLFGAGGLGTIFRPTSVEVAHLRAGAIGGGIRLLLAGGRAGLTAEFAYGLTNLPGLARLDRVSLAASFRF